MIILPSQIAREIASLTYFLKITCLQLALSESNETSNCKECESKARKKEWVLKVILKKSFIFASELRANHLVQVTRV